MMKPMRLFYLSVAIAGLAVGAYLLLMSCQTPPPPAPPPVAPPPSPVVETKPATTDFPIADATVAKLKELFGKPEAIETFCYGKEPLEPKLKLLREISETLRRHAAAETLPAGDAEPAYAQLVTELGHYRTALWPMACKVVPDEPAVREIPAGSFLLKPANPAAPAGSKSPERLADGPLVIVFPDGRRQAAYWSNNRLIETANPASGEPKPVVSRTAARERCLTLYSEITETLAAWQDAKWVAIKRPKGLADLCDIFFRARLNQKNPEDYQLTIEAPNRIREAFQPFFSEYYDPLAALPETTWRVNPRLPEFFLPILQGDAGAIKGLDIGNYQWNGTVATVPLPRGELEEKAEKACAWVRDYIMVCSYARQPPESQPVVDLLVKEMAARLQVPPKTWTDWVIRQNLAATLDYWRRMAWVGLAKPPELAQAQTQTVPRTWFEALTEMMASDPAWAASLLAARPERSAAGLSWTWSNESSGPAGRMVLNKERLDRLEAAWARQQPLLLPRRLFPPLHPLLQAGPLALKLEVPANPTGRMVLNKEQLADVLVPAKMWLDDCCVQMLEQRLAGGSAVKAGQGRVLSRPRMVEVPDEAGAQERLLTLLAARYQKLAAGNPGEILQKENLRLKLMALGNSTGSGDLRERLAALNLPGKSFLEQPELKTSIIPLPDDVLRALARNAKSSAMISQYDQLLGMDKEYFKTRCFAGPIDKKFIMTLAAILPPKTISSEEKLFQLQSAMLEMLDRSVMRRAQAPALDPGDTQENLDLLVLSLLDTVAGSLNYYRRGGFTGYIGDNSRKATALGRQIHQMLSRWRDAKDWQALKKPRWLRRLPCEEAFVPAVSIDSGYDDGFWRIHNPCFLENLLFRIAEGVDQEKAFQELRMLGDARVLSTYNHAMANMVPDQEFMAMAQKLLAPNDDPRDWKWHIRQRLINNLYVVIVGKVDQEKLPDGCKPEEIAKLVEQMITYYRREDDEKIRSRLAVPLFTLQKATWRAMPMPETLKQLDLTTDLPEEVRKLIVP